MNLFDILQLIGGIILSIGYIPQIKQIRETKNSDGVNTTTFFSIFTGIALMQAYALNLFFNLNAGGLFLLTNTIALLSVSTLLFYVFKYKTNKINISSYIEALNIKIDNSPYFNMKRAELEIKEKTKKVNKNK